MTAVEKANSRPATRPEPTAAMIAIGKRYGAGDDMAAS
jgi:hypothetical protein